MTLPADQGLAVVNREDTLGRERPVFVQHHVMAGRCPSPRLVTHEFAALAFYTTGRAEIEQRGRWTVSAGDVVVVPAGEAHRMVAGDGVEAWGAGFCAPCLAADGATALLEPFARVRSGGTAVVSISEERREFLTLLFVELGREVAGVDEASVAAQRSLTVLILREVQRASPSREEALPGEGLAAQALRVIEQRCLGPLTLQEVAAAVRRSPSHVTTELRRATGRSAVEWIIAGRLAEARRRLLHSDEMVEVIAERVGYADATHFTRLFRRAHGVTPAAWRAERRTTLAVSSRARG